MLVSSFNLSQSFNYAPYLFQIRDQLFLSTDPDETPFNVGSGPGAEKIITDPQH
jgi:hypothetical protein